ncbi:MAG TPA: hypothetical protein VH857_02515 [Actinomycetes bacterium]|nr:hypothetical protein [Actinomycetes bacterium]
MKAKDRGVGLSEAGLLDAAGELIFERGEDCVANVRGPVESGESARASVQGQSVYQVELDWSAYDVRGVCTCPYNARGEFCKHLVAVGLAVLGRRPADVPPKQVASVQGYLEDLDAPSLRTVLAQLAEEHLQVAESLLLRAELAAGNGTAAAEILSALVRDVLEVRGFIDYRRSFDVAADAESVLDELERTLGTDGGADLAAPALRIAVTRLRRITEHADDSAGILGGASQRALDLYARACREGNPDGRKLARWLVKFRDESPGWPQATLVDFVAAFDDKAMTTYRSAVQKLADRFEGEDGWKRHEADLMLLELADHDGDVDRAIEILSSGEYTRYGEIVDRLRQHGRHDEVIGWMDAAVSAGRVSGHFGPRGGTWLDPDDVAATYLAAGRPDDAVEVLRRKVLEMPGAKSLAALVRLARRLHRAAAERAWAIQALRERAVPPFGNGAYLVEIALAHNDLDGAWDAAHEFGAGHQWERLAKASRDARPADAAALYQANLEKDLVHPDSKVYASIAKRLTIVRDLRALAGEEEVFADYLGALRDTYRRRPSLMAALDKAGL